jgi:hypothetical protein
MEAGVYEPSVCLAVKTSHFMEINFIGFESKVIASAVLSKNVPSDFLLLAWLLSQRLGSSSFWAEAVL